MKTQHLSSLGYMAQMFQRPVSFIERLLAEIGAEPVAVVNGVALYSGDDHNAVLLRMCESKEPAPMLYGPPTGPVEFIDGGDDDQDEADDDPTPPILGNRLTQYLERANHG